MIANILTINTEQTKVMLFTKDEKIKIEFKILIKETEIKHQKQVTVLGNTLADTLTWDYHVKNVIIPSICNRVRTNKTVAPYLDPKF